MKQLILLFSFIPFLGFSQWNQMGSNIEASTNGQLIGGGYISMSSDGSIIAIGSHTYNSLQGKVEVLKYDGSQWNSMGTTLTGDAFGDFFGWATSLSNDGLTLAVGAFYNDSEYQDAGEVKVFHYNGSDWVQVGGNIYGESKSDYEGRSISINGDGTVVAVGVNNNGIGKARIYKYDGTSWVKLGTDILGTEDADQFGRSISINDAGDRVAVGANQSDISALNSGLVRVFQLTNGVWTQVGQDLLGAVAGDNFGISVSLNQLGDVLAVGANSNDEVGSSSGQVKVLKLNNNTWEQVGNSINGDAAGDNLGWTVSLDDSGNTLAAGAYLNKTQIYASGEVKVLKNVNNEWTLVGSPIYGSSSQANFGKAVALNSDGTILGSSAPAGSYNYGYVQILKYTDTQLGTSSNSLQQVSVFPNPATDVLNVKNVSAKTKYTIYNAAGQWIKSGILVNDQVPVSTLSKGVYIISLEDNAKISRTKFIKE